MNRIKFYCRILREGGDGVKRIKEKIKFIFRTVIYYPWQNELITFILQHKYLSKKIFSYNAIIVKMHKPYLCHFFSLKKRLNSIKETYSFIDNCFPQSISEKLYSTGSVRLAVIEAQHNEQYHIDLLLYIEYPKEGELSLQVKNKEELILATITFSFIKNESNRDQLFIGGIQGSKKNISHDEIKRATKNLHGLFPKKLAIESLFIFLKLLNLHIEKLGVGNRQHVFLSLRYKSNIKILADYDNFYQSLNGKQLASGLWLLPNEISRKSIENISSKKRNLYRQRYQLLDKAITNMKERLDALQFTN